MIRIYVKKQSNYPVSAPKIKKRLRDFLEKRGIFSDSLVNISLVGSKKMGEISKRFLKEKTIHNVLTFSENESGNEFIFPPDGFIRLGEIVICFPKAIEEANHEGLLIEDKVYNLVEHGARHLLGDHHN